MQKVNILGTDYVILTHKISEDAELEKTILQDIAMNTQKKSLLQI